MNSDYKEYISELTELEKKAAPKEIFWEGDFNLLREGRRVSVVGSRKVSDIGLRRTNRVCKKLIERDITVVSGLALGVDKRAHEYTLYKGGKTIAVVGTPLNTIYPKANTELFNQIKKEHLVISQFPEGYPFLKKNFPIRNRTMALISDATIIIEATENSGTRHQGWEALKLGRLVYILESIANNNSLKWPKEMIEYGAQILTQENLEESLDQIPFLTAKMDYAF